MPEVPSLQPQWCEECGQPEMAWVVAAANTNTEQHADKDIDSQTGTADAVIGNKIETGTEKADTEKLEESEDNVEPFYLCTDPTCKGHGRTLGNIIRWKLRHASDYEYSKGEVRKIVKDAIKQSARDYRTVSESVEGITDTRVQNSQVEKTPPQQLGRCGCGKQQKPTQRSVGKTATEQQSVTNTTRVMQSLKASVAAIPLVNIEVGGKTQSGDETTDTEISTFNTIDTGTFPICPDLGCEEHLKMIGIIESWKMRNDSTREYSNEEVDERITKVIAQEKRGDKLVTEAVENVREEMLSSELDQETRVESSLDGMEPPPNQKPFGSRSDPATESDEVSIETEDTAAATITDQLYDQLNGIEPVDEDSAFQHDTLNDEIVDIGSQFTRIDRFVTQLEEHPDTHIRSDAKQQQLLDQLEAMTTQDENTEAQIDQLTESVTAINPQQPQADDQLDLFTEQVADLEANNDIHTDLATDTTGHPEIQQLDSRLDAIDADDAEIIQRRDSLKQDVDLLDRRYDRTTENIAELDPDQDTHADQTKAPDASEGADETTTSEDNETTEAANQRKETTTTGQTNGTGTSESDGSSPADDRGDTRGGESETEKESTTVEPGAKSAQATGSSPDRGSSAPDTDGVPPEITEAGEEGDRIMEEIKSQPIENGHGASTQNNSEKRKTDDSGSSV